MIGELPAPITGRQGTIQTLKPYASQNSNTQTTGTGSGLLGYNADGVREVGDEYAVVLGVLLA